MDTPDSSLYSTRYRNDYRKDFLPPNTGFQKVLSDYDLEPVILEKELRPLWQSLRFFLFLPVSIDSSGRFHFRWRSPIAVLTLLCWLPLAVASLTTVALRLRADLYSSRGFWPQRLSFSASFSYAALLPLLVWPFAPRIAAMLNAWARLEARYKRLTGRPLLLGLRGRSWAAALACLLPCAVLVAFNRLIPVRLPTWQLPTFLHFYALLCALVGTWVTLCRAVRVVAGRLAAE